MSKDLLEAQREFEENRRKQQEEYEQHFKEVWEEDDPDGVNTIKALEKDREPTVQEPDTVQDNTTEGPVSTEGEPDQEPSTNDDTPPAADTNQELIELKSKITVLEEEAKKERQRTNSWHGRIKKANEKIKRQAAEITRLNKKIEELAQAPAGPGSNEPAPVEDDNQVLQRFREDFPELADVISILERRINTVAPKGDPTESAPAASATDDDDLTDVDDLIDPDDDPATDDTSDSDKDAADVQAEATKHYKLTREAHPDLDEIVKTGVLLTWINQQNDLVKPHLLTVYYKGDAESVIKLVSEFKKVTGWTSGIVKNKTDAQQKKADKLAAMTEVSTESPGPPKPDPDPNDYMAAAKDAGLI